MPPSSIRGLVPRRPHASSSCCTTTTYTSSPTTTPSSSLPHPWSTSSPSTTQIRHATFIRRPRRPYQFTQLIHLSDGSTFTVRTTSPQPVYKSVQDTRNHILWQPTERSLQNIEHDEAGKLAAFRERFGRGFDMRRTQEEMAADAERKRVRALEAEVRRQQLGAAAAAGEGQDEETTSESEAERKKQEDEKVQQLLLGDEAELDEDDEMMLGLGLSAGDGEGEEGQDDGFDALGDLISGYADKVEPKKKVVEKAAPKAVVEPAKKGGKPAGGAKGGKK